MSKTTTSNILNNLQKSLFDLSARNPLVNSNPDQLWFLNQKEDSLRIEKIYHKQQFLEKEYGLNATLQVNSFIRWQRKKTNQFYTSPLLIQPVQIIKKKREQLSWAIENEDENKWMINPIIRKLFRDEFEITLPEETDHVSSIFDFLQKEFKSITVHAQFNDENNWQIIQQEAIGIFNYRKAALYKDYERIQVNPEKNVNHLLGETGSDNYNKIKSIAALDASQKKAIQTALQKNTVIQGPPGTGKSETLVTLILQLISENKKVLFVSEKKSALDVVFQRLKKKKLDWTVAYFDGSKNEKANFYNHLKKTWDKLSDRNSIGIKNTASIPPMPVILDLYPDKILKSDEIQQISIQFLHEKLLSSGFNISDFHIRGNAPDYKIWNQSYQFLKSFDEAITAEFGVNHFYQTAFFALNASIFSEANTSEKIKNHLNQIEKVLQQIQKVSNKFGLDQNLNAFIKLAIAGSILGMVNKQQLDLLKPDQKKHKQFNTLAKKYQQLKIKLSQIELMNQRWVKKPTVAEITELSDLLRQKKKSKSILSILKRNAVKSHSWFSEFSPALSVNAKLQLLEEIRQEWHLKGELDLLKVKLKHDLNITDPDTEIDHILQVRSKLNAVSSNEYVQLLSHPESVQLIEDLTALHPTINRAVNLIHYLFDGSVREDLNNLMSYIQLLRDEIPLIEKYEYELAALFKTDISVLNFIRSNPESLEKLDALLTYSQLLLQSKYLTAYKNLTGENLLSDFNLYKNKIKHFETGQIEFIHFHLADQLHEFEKLAAIPASRLKAEKQQVKLKFKESKRVLAHELNKKRQHLAVKELISAHADLILNLQPVWMMNPLSVGYLLPCQESLFDVVIFDEASQIPLEDAIPAVYRGAQLVVVGDSKQMPPSDFFKSTEDTITLLDQADFNLEKIFLHNHYRSEHPVLIHFSNAHFYDFELAALPPVHDKNPIEHVFVDGVFEDQKNIAEAKAVVLYYQNLLKQGTEDVLIIAFSKEQQHAIESELHNLKLHDNENLLIRNLENAQGIEKKVVLISIGYAKDKAGVFRKNFGPVNHESGANRLNVLFTRAIQKLVVFSSVSSSEFGFSENSGTTLLSSFLRFVETQSVVKEISMSEQPVLHQKIDQLLKKNKLRFNYYTAQNGSGISCFVNHETGHILLVDPCTALDESKDFLAMMNGILSRFKKCLIVLSTEYLQNPIKTEERILKFMQSER